MAGVAMEVAWRGASELGKASRTKRAWDADTQKLMHLMLSQFAAREDVTLDLLGSASAAGSSPSLRGQELDTDSHSPATFLELDPDRPLPAGWEKCLDLKTGELYFVSKATGTRTSEDPRKQQQQGGEIPALACLIPFWHEFLASKVSETQREESRRSVSTSAGNSAGNATQPTQPVQMLSFSTGTRLWSLQLADHHTSLCLSKTDNTSPHCTSPEEAAAAPESTRLELDLNLAAGGSSPSHHPQGVPEVPPQVQVQAQMQGVQAQQGVCTMEMVEQALKRTEKAIGKRPAKLSGSTSLSLLSSVRLSPSTSSSSSTSSRSHGTTPPPPPTGPATPATPGVGEAQSGKDESMALVMGACTRCLMYVMLNKSDPKCPRCESEVPLDFSSRPPAPKRQRLANTTSSPLHT